MTRYQHQIQCIQKRTIPMNYKLKAVKQQTSFSKDSSVYSLGNEYRIQIQISTLTLTSQVAILILIQIGLYQVSQASVKHSP